MVPPWRALWALGLTLAGCQSGTVVRTTGGIQAPVSSLTFPGTWVGFPSQLSVKLTNTALQSRTASMSVSPPFSAPQSLTISATNAASFIVSFEPDSAGPASGVLTITAEDGTFTIQLSGEGLVPPNCAAPDDCHTSNFSADAGACLIAPQPDGTACGGGELCLANASCRGGDCLGGSVDCDDGNVCTLDYCDASVGCVHLDQSANCPPATAICAEATCDPISGCGTGPAPDGTLCGSFSCSSTDICLLGSCTSAPTPEGSPCSPDYPCQAHGSCEQGTCEIPDAGVLSPIWTYSPPAGFTLTFRGLIDANNDVYWIECSSAECVLSSFTQNGYTRFKAALPGPPGSDGGPTLAAGTLALAGSQVVYVAPNRWVSSFDSETGASLWTADLSGVADGGTGAVHPGWVLGEPVISLDGGVATIPINGAWLDGGASTVELSTDGGAVLGMSSWEAPLDSLVCDAAGTAYVVDGHRVDTLVAGASPLWDSSEVNTLRAVSNGWLYAGVDGGTLAIATDGGGGHSLGLVSSPLGTDGVAAGSGGGFVTGYSEIDGGTFLSLRGFDPGSAELSWLFILSPGSSVTSPLLTSRASAVILGAPDGGTAPWLAEITGDGLIPYVCSLPSDVPLDLRSAALGAQVLFVQESWPDGSSQLQAFNMVGVAPATSGWVGPRGNRFLTGTELGP